MSVVVSNSPVFSSPSSSFFRNNIETLAVTLSHLKSTQSPTASSPLSPFSPLRVRLQKPPVSIPSSSLASTSVSGSRFGAGSPQALLKRKRPARLDIPAVDMGLGAPETPAAGGRILEEVEMEREGYGYSVYSKRGRRAAMEDRFSATVGVQGDSKQALFGIFDGHGGAKAAQFASQNLDKNILKEVSKMGERGIEDAVKCGYLKTDSEFLKEDIHGGSCCVTALIREGNLVVSNAGDCCAVISNQGIAEALTSDHRPSREDEKDRVLSKGAYVDKIHGVWRIQGSLAVSRGIGDRQLKQWVIAEPETKICRIKPEHELLILASDGLWDKVSNQEAVDVARPFCLGIDNPEPLSACKRLADLAVSRGSCDDISIMLIRLRHFI
ncbi:phosphatase 2C family protein [Tripterygium wilfordii]|uniref:protein-serine/threonine phosphatase n=1 Tax=Tripterygium wilfordii TaxID=458696 RepID=A0A7J7C076_TRIWF|nr:probable protein phosphatase 2C 25 [Tripterygium wilfordii]KAF5727325.1 phosphatase 2C family protein [Tripterygium wilfordii]